MGGSFTKQFGKLTTKVVDPFGISKPLRKIIDPLNIMDPLNVLPTSGDKWLTADKNYGGAAQKWLGLNQKSSDFYPMTKGLSSSPEFFLNQQQFQGNINLQNQKRLNDLRLKGQSYQTAQTVAPAIETTQQPTTENQNIGLAQSQINDTTSTDMPADFIYKPSTATKTNNIAANSFKTPDMSGIRFGGI
jgi:hypothetical protein